jgi:hypothetical protein
MQQTRLEEYNRVKSMVKNNGYNLSKLKLHTGRLSATKKDEQPRKWAKFTCFNPLIHILTKTFKHTNLSIACNMNNNIKHKTSLKQLCNDKY